MKEMDLMSLLPDEVLLHIISYSSQSNDFLFWSTRCNKRFSAICRDTKLITMMKDRFTKSYIHIDSEFDEKNIDRVFHLPNRQVTRVMKYKAYSIYIRKSTIENKKSRPFELVSEYDFVKGILTSYVPSETRALPMSYAGEIVDYKNSEFILTPPSKVDYRCELSPEGVPCLYQNMQYKFDLFFEHGIIQSYQANYINAQVNAHGKLDMKCDHKHSLIEIKDGIIISFHQTQEFDGRGDGQAFDYDNIDGVTDSESYRQAVIKLQRWNSLFRYRFLNVNSNEIKMIDTPTFVQESIPDLKGYKRYIDTSN